MRRPIVPLAIVFALLAPPAAAQLAGERTPGVRVSGTVHDSVAHAPLAGAWVQLAGADSTARAARTVGSD